MGEWWVLLAHFFLFLWILVAAAVGPFVIATRVIVVVLGLVSLEVGAADIFTDSTVGCDGRGGGGGWVGGALGSRWHNKCCVDKGMGFGLSLFDGV